MAGNWGEHLRLSIFGESHGVAVGIMADGLPPGETIDQERIAKDLQRRAPGRSPLSTPRREEDEAEILSGLYEGHTTGAPLCAIIRNRNMRSKDYNGILRPGHADWTALLKYGGQADMRGGGHFSGRLTAPLVLAGSLAAQILERRGLRIYSRIVRIGGITDDSIPPDEAAWRRYRDRTLPAHEDAAAAFEQEILNAQKEGDSVGGLVEVMALGVPGGLGEPFFGSLESVVSALLFSVPAVKGVEFGDGFALASLRGHESNDELYVCPERDDMGENPADNPQNTPTRHRQPPPAIASYSNHQGGILGGISNGEPIILRAAFKPTPSIARAQRTVDPVLRKDCILKTTGRHDPCIVPRAVPVTEAVLWLGLMDRWLAAGRT